MQATDELARQKDLNLEHRFDLLPGQKTIRNVGKSALAKSLSSVTQAQVDQVCLKDGKAEMRTSVALNSLVLHAMPALQNLQIVLPFGLVGDLDRILPRNAHLTKLATSFSNEGLGYEDALYQAQGALISSLLHLQQLQDLSLSELPLDMDLGAVASWLPLGLTSLSLDFGNCYEDRGEQSLQHLAPLSALQRLQMSGCLDGRQTLPPSLSRLTWLDLSGSNGCGWDVGLEFSFVGVTALQHLDLHESRLLAWPEGLSELQALTHLDMLGCLDDGEVSAEVVLPPRLESLALGVLRV
ncbi:hypothetical protein N2152v2_009348 [Parachlorella kessleri]